MRLGCPDATRCNPGILPLRDCPCRGIHISSSHWTVQASTRRFSGLAVAELQLNRSISASERASTCSKLEASQLFRSTPTCKLHGVQRFLAVDFVRRGFGFRHLFLGNNSHSCVGYLGRLPPQLPHAQVRVISEKLVAKNETASDAFLNLNRPFSAVSKPPPTPVTRRKT